MQGKHTTQGQAQTEHQIDASKATITWASCMTTRYSCQSRFAPM